jgi:phosphatidylserine/phosphatidylglycerophosphate/cardiolipin synthase-like enzyme
LINDKHYRFPWREGNRFELLVNGEQFFPAMLQAIRLAERHILLELYLFESGRVAGRFIDALLEAASRGVAVYLLLDDFGAHKLGAHDRQQLRSGGVHLNFYNPLHYGALRRNLFRDHRKLLVVDGRIAFTGGAGITDSFDTLDRPSGWHEVMLRITGPCVADWQHLFEQSWNNWASPPLALPPPLPASYPGSRPGRVVLNAPSRMEIKRTLVKHIRTAERRVWLATAYFIPSWKIRRLLRRAVHHGVDVRLLLPGPVTDHPAVRHAGRRFYGSLLRNGVRIYEYQPRFLHAKMLLCDDWVSIGSSNIDRWNLRWNLEANQEVADQNLARELQQLFERDFADSIEIKYETWFGRPWHPRLQEWFWGMVDRWLERRSQRRKGERD